MRVTYRDVERSSPLSRHRFAGDVPVSGRSRTNGREGAQVAGLVKQPIAPVSKPDLRLAEERLAGSAGAGGVARSRQDRPSTGPAQQARVAYASRSRIRGGLPDRAGSPPSASRPPTPEEAKLLDLLREGLKDRAIARALGIGERTVQRRLSRLMSTLGAKTRFQAAINAVHRGWL